MSATVMLSRASRRTTAVAVTAGLFLLILVYAVRDLNNKLSVMTSSNMDYQKMTDQQMEKIKLLNKSIKDTETRFLDKAQQQKSEESEFRRSLQKKLKEAKSQIETSRLENEKLQRSYEGLSEDAMTNAHKLNQLSTETDKLTNENNRLREQLSSISAERNSLHSQYLALFKEQQNHADLVQNLQSERDRLKLQLQEAGSNKISAGRRNAKSSSPSIPALQPQVQVVQKGSTRKSAPNLNIEEPFVPNNRISSTSKQNLVGGGNAPVVAEPPHNIYAQNGVRNQEHFVRKEDVMEAPKLLNSQGHPQQNFNQYLHHIPQQQYHQQAPSGLGQQHQYYMHHPGQQQQHAPALHFQRREIGENLDQAVDGAGQLQPGLFQRAGIGNKEDEEDDFADGQIQLVRSSLRLRNCASNLQKDKNLQKFLQSDIANSEIRIVILLSQHTRQ